MRPCFTDESAFVRSVVFHHLHQLFADLTAVVHDEQLHYGEGAVLGVGKRFNSLGGSARTACN
jgi:hypothetical protein